MRRTPVIVAVLSLLLAGAAAFAAADRSEGPVTFSKDVAPILQENCQTCHRPGDIAPMSLLTYQEARPWAKSIRQVVVRPHHAAVARRRGGRHLRQRLELERAGDLDAGGLGRSGRAGRQRRRLTAGEDVRGQRLEGRHARPRLLGAGDLQPAGDGGRRVPLLRHAREGRAGPLVLGPRGQAGQPRGGPPRDRVRRPQRLRARARRRRSAARVPVRHGERRHRHEDGRRLGARTQRRDEQERHRDEDRRRHHAGLPGALPQHHRRRAARPLRHGALPHARDGAQASAHGADRSVGPQHRGRGRQRRAQHGVDRAREHPRALDHAAHALHR